MNNREASYHPLILDGAMGTELLRLEIDLPLPLWSAVANDTDRECIFNIHKDYSHAGADVLITNTFRSTPYAYQKAGFSKRDALLKAKDNLKKAVSLAKQTVSGNQLIAGSIAPIEDCYSPELFPGETQFDYSIEPILRWFQESKVDIILFETMGNFREISCAIKSVINCNLPVWLSLIIKDETHLLDGHPLDDILDKLSTSSIEILLLNCNTIQLTMNAIQGLKQNWDKSWGVYPNMGIENPEPDGKINHIISDENWKKYLKEILIEKPDVIGACCGSSPKHIRIIKNLIQTEIVA